MSPNNTPVRFGQFISTSEIKKAVTKPAAPAGRAKGAPWPIRQTRKMKAAYLILCLFLAAFFSPYAAYCADSGELMLKKIVGVNGYAPSGVLSTAAHALVDKRNNILIKAYDGALIAPRTGGTIAQESVATLTSASTISFAPGVSSSAFKLTPAHTATINGVKTGAVAGRSYFFVITTSGTTSYTLTFGTNFKTTATLATGTTTAKVFVLTFIYDGVNFNEVSRTAAM